VYNHQSAICLILFAIKFRNTGSFCTVSEKLQIYNNFQCNVIMLLHFGTCYIFNTERIKHAKIQPRFCFASCLSVSDVPYFFVKTRHASPRLNLSRYCPVRRTCCYFGDGTPYRQFLLSQWRYAVHLRGSNSNKITIPLRIECVSQGQNASTLVFDLGFAGGAYDTPLHTQSAGEWRGIPLRSFHLRRSGRLD